MGGKSAIADNAGTGVCNGRASLLTMNGSSSIHGNRTNESVGGVSSYSGILTMTGSSAIYDNHANSTYGTGGVYASVSQTYGGALIGVYCAPHTFANVYGNTPKDCATSPY
jgi:hypothetical protein